MRAAPATLEHRYRRLLRLLPPDHRSARGDELLGVLLDLDAGRARPSPRQVLGVIGLALRLRLRGHATAWVLAVTTAIVVAIDLSAWMERGSVRFGTHWFQYSDAVFDLMLPGLLRALAAVAWSRGARRAAVLFCALVAPHLLAVDLLVLVLVAVTPARSWRGAPWAAAGWAFAATSLLPSQVTDGRLSLAVWTAAATGAIVHLAAGDNRRPLLTGVLVGLAICAFTPVVGLAAAGPFSVLWCAAVALLAAVVAPFAALARAVTRSGARS